MKKNCKKLLCVLLMVSLLLSLAACSSNKDNASNEVPQEQNPTEVEPTTTITTAKDELIIALDREPVSLDPADANVNVKRMVESNIYDTLLNFNIDMEVVSNVAESWENVDELTWKFNLKKGIKFHNGEELKASDVVFSIKRQFDIPAGEGNVSQLDPNGFETPDDYTVIIRTTEPYAFVEQMVSSPALSILNEKAVTEMGVEAHARNPIGTGPYKFVSWTAGDNITLERNDDYWGEEKAKIKTVVLRIITESASRTIDLESGGIDMTVALSNNDAERIEQNQETQLLMHTSTTLRYIAFNTEKEKLSDARVRQALYHATDVESLQNIVYGENTSVLAISPVAPGLPGRNESLVQYEYNVEKAKSMLAEAGYANGLELEFMYLAGSQNNMLAEMLQSMWGEAGVSLVLKPTESAALTTALNNGEHEICVAGTSFALNDPGDGLYRFFHSSTAHNSSNRTNLANAEIDKYLDEVIVTPDQEKRNELVYKVQELVHAQAPMIYIANPKTLVGASGKMQGLELIQNGFYDFSTIYFSE